MSWFACGLPVRFPMLSSRLTYRPLCWLPALVLALVVPPALAQRLPAMRLDALTPSGGQVGTTFEVAIVAGVDLEGVQSLTFSHPGITAVASQVAPSAFLLEPYRPRFAVTIAPEVAPGIYQVQAIGHHGVSNARLFAVSDLAEHLESELTARGAAVAVGSVINGHVDAQAVDQFSFKAVKGQRVLIDCHAERIDSRLDATLVLLDSAAHEIKRNADTHHRDPMIDFVAESDGVYQIQIFDVTYRGGLEYFYRVTISAAPYIDVIFPAAGLPGSTATYTLLGRNLPGSTEADGLSVNESRLEKLEVQIHIPVMQDRSILPFNASVRPAGLDVDGMSWRLEVPQGRSNPVHLGYASAKVIVEQEPNNDPARANAVELPCEIAGQFYRADAPGGDLDWFTFKASKDQIFDIDMFAQRLGLPVDPALVIQRFWTDDEGNLQFKDCLEADDTADSGGHRGAGSQDPASRFVVPEDGTYRLLVRDLNAGKRGDLVYRLAIRPAEPDFRVMLVNAKATQVEPFVLRQGGVQVIDVVATRMGGFDGDIDVSPEYLPLGVSCRPVTIAAGFSSAKMLLQAATDAPPWVGRIRVRAGARIGHGQVIREARHAQPAWDNTPNWRVSAHTMLTVFGGWTFPFRVELAGNQPLLTAGGGRNIPVKIHRRAGFTEKITLKVDPVPNDFKAKNAEFEGDTTEGKIHIEVPAGAASAPVQLVVAAETKINWVRSAKAARLAQVRQTVNQIIGDAEAAGKHAEAAQVEAGKHLDEAEAANQQADQAKKEAEKSATEADDQLKAVTAKLTELEQAADSDPQQEGLADQVAEARTVVRNARAKAAAAAGTKKDAEKAAEEAAAKKKSAAEAKGKTDSALEVAGATGKAAAEVIKALEAMGTETHGYKVASVPVGLIELVPSPLAVELGSDQAVLKQAGEVLVQVKVTRQNGFANKVKLEPVWPDAVAGLEAEPLILAADQTEGILRIGAATDATAGEHAVTIRATVRFQHHDLAQSTSLKLTVESDEAQAPAP